MSSADFANLVRTHQPFLLRLAGRFVRDRATAEDVVQETWLSVLRGLPRFQGRSSLKTWITRILVNTAKSWLRREHRLVPMETPPEDPSALNASADALLEQKQMRAMMEAAVATLTPRQQVVVRLRDLEQWDTPEVRDHVALTDTNQRVLLHRGRRRVRELVTEQLLEAAS